MEIGPALSHPLLQVAVQVGEATIRDACDPVPELAIQVDLDRFADGRDGLQITLRGPDCRSRFSMVLRNYFDRDALWRATRAAWRQRLPNGHPAALPARARFDLN